MTPYEFRCLKCRKVHTKFLSHSQGDDLIHQDCEVCGEPMERVFGNTAFQIDWVNGGFHGERINFGLGKKFKSARERDNYAASLGLVRADV